MFFYKATALSGLGAKYRQMFVQLFWTAWTRIMMSFFMFVLVFVWMLVKTEILKSVIFIVSTNAIWLKLLQLIKNDMNYQLLKFRKDRTSRKQPVMEIAIKMMTIGLDIKLQIANRSRRQSQIISMILIVIGTEHAKRIEIKF